MYRIDDTTNDLVPLENVTFGARGGFPEAGDVQQWIAALPMVLGEDLLVIAEQLPCFDDSCERPGLLALDKSGRLVIIEIKLGDSGQDGFWQAAECAARCALLKKDQVIQISWNYIRKTRPAQDPTATICAHLGVDSLEDMILNEVSSQRVIMIGTNLRKNVISTALWLNGLGLSVQCFKMTLYARPGRETFLHLKQVTPVSETQQPVSSDLLHLRRRAVTASPPEGPSQSA